MDTAFIKILLEFGLSATVCILCLWMFYKIFIAMRDDNKERETRDRDTITRLSEIVSTNSKVLLENSNVMKEISGQIHDINEKVEDIQSDLQEIKIKQDSRKN